MPFKNFTSEVLTSNDVDTYLMRQGVMTFATAAARDSALSGVLDEGMVTYLEDAPNRFTYYNGSTWLTMVSEYTTWSPTYGNITVGNGSASGVYAYTGPGTVTAAWAFTLGSTSAIGTSPTLTLPVAPTGSTDLGSVVIDMLDSSGGTRTKGGLIFSSGSTVELVSFNAGGTFVSLSGLTATSPFTWATSDVISFTATYRV